MAKKPPACCASTFRRRSGRWRNSAPTGCRWRATAIATSRCPARDRGERRFRNSRRMRVSPRPIKFGVNINNREPLIAPDYSLTDLLALSERVETLGFDSVWVGDSLFSKPRFEPITLLSAISQRTGRVKLGTACMVSGTRNPLYLALEWATLDHLSNGRTILGTGMGNPEEGVRREYAALGLDFERRASIFEEGLAVLRELWTEGETNFQGDHFHFD